MFVKITCRDSDTMVVVTEFEYAFVQLQLLSLSHSRRKRSFVFLHPIPSSSFTKSKFPSMSGLVHAQARALLVMHVTPEKQPTQLPFEQQQNDNVRPKIIIKCRSGLSLRLPLSSPLYSSTWLVSPMPASRVQWKHPSFPVTKRHYL